MRATTSLIASAICVPFFSKDQWSRIHQSEIADIVVVIDVGVAWVGTVTSALPCVLVMQSRSWSELVVGWFFVGGRVILAGYVIVKFCISWASFLCLIVERVCPRSVCGTIVWSGGYFGPTVLRVFPLCHWVDIHCTVKPVIEIFLGHWYSLLSRWRSSLVGHPRSGLFLAICVFCIQWWCSRE